MAGRGRGHFALSDADWVQQRVDSYFESLKRTTYREVWNPKTQEKVWMEIEDDPLVPGVAGLAYALDIDRTTLLLYTTREPEEIDKHGNNPELPEIQRILRRARNRIEALQEQALFRKDGYKGAQFSLGINFKWRESAEEGGGGGLKIVEQPPLPADKRKAIAKWEPEE